MNSPRSVFYATVRRRLHFHRPLGILNLSRKPALKFNQGIDSVCGCVSVCTSASTCYRYVIDTARSFPLRLHPFPSPTK